MQTFDTHEYIKDLQQGNVPLKQAEAHSNALKKVLNEELATKRDLNELETRLEAKIDSKISEVHIQLKDLEGRLNTKIDTAILSLIKWLVPLLIGQTGLLFLLIRFFNAPAPPG